MKPWGLNKKRIDYRIKRYLALFLVAFLICELYSRDIFHVGWLVLLMDISLEDILESSYSLWLGVGLLAYTGLFTSEASFQGKVMSWLVFAGVCISIGIVLRKVLGEGDALVIASIFLWMGVVIGVQTIFSAFMMALVWWGVAKLVIRKTQIIKRASVAFTPFLTAGVMVYWMSL